MRRIILFTSSFPFGRGEQFLANELSEIGKAVDEIVLVPYYAGGNLTARILPDVPARIFVRDLLYAGALKNMVRIRPRMLRWYLEDLFARPWAAKVLKKIAVFWAQSEAVLRGETLRALVKSIRAEDVLYFYWGTDAVALIPWLRAKGFSNRIVVRFHGSDLYENVTGYLPLREQIFAKADLCLFVSENGMEYARSKWPKCEAKCRVNRLGVRPRDLSRRNPQDTSLVVSCSNIDDNKRVWLIAEVLARTGEPVEWHHFGDGPGRTKLEEVLATLGGSVEVTLHGRVEPSKIMEFYEARTPTLLVNLSRSEGIPVSIMEAFSAGIPVFATSVGGVSEIVDGTNGWLVGAEEPAESLAIGLRAALGELAAGGEARRHAAMGTWESRYNLEQNAKDLVAMVFGR
ncbi:MAG: glycosyltransferase [Fibrobacteres bacterium]|nr:glycosyltransferase [Fibrobacterota bacterium]